jgi:hypothetical protein
MIVKDRTTLKLLFNKNSTPTAREFAMLIDSMLTKRDDQFFGKWRAGMGYKDGDVVLHNDKLYVFVGKMKNQAGTADCEDDDCAGNNPPGSNAGCWQEMRIRVEDDDWEIIRSGGEAVAMCARVYGQVGIGMEQGELPEAFFHLADDRTTGSQFLFNPIDSEVPTFKIKHAPFTPHDRCDDAFEANAPFLTQALDRERAEFATNTLGFLFYRLPRVGTPSEATSYDQRSAPPQAALDLLFVTSERDRPRIGIGTTEPASMLDVTDRERGQLLINPAEKKDPELILINLSPETARNYLAQSVGRQFATFSTDAPNGFVFKRGIEYERFISEEHDADCGQSLVVIDAAGNVGIGTTHPRNRLEIHQQGGVIQAAMSGDNPSVNVINTRPASDGESPVITPNFVAIGASNEAAVFSSNSEDGFVFRHDADPEAATGSIDLTVGTEVLRLEPEKPHRDRRAELLYNARVEGNVVARGFYVEGLPTRTRHDEVSGARAHELLDRLTLHRYKPEQRPEWQYGFMVPRVMESFPELIKTLPDDTKVIAYQNLVGVLVAAVRDLEDRVKKLEQQVRQRL